MPGQSELEGKLWIYLSNESDIIRPVKVDTAHREMTSNLSPVMAAKQLTAHAVEIFHNQRHSVSHSNVHPGTVPI